GHVVGVAVLSFVIARLLSPAIALLLFFFLGSVDLRLLPSFPTRRSSDLHFSEERVRRPFSLRQNSPFLRLFVARVRRCRAGFGLDRKSTRLNSSHVKSSYAVVCLKKKKMKCNCRAFETRQTQTMHIV